MGSLRVGLELRDGLWGAEGIANEKALKPEEESIDWG